MKENREIKDEPSLGKILNFLSFVMGNEGIQMNTPKDAEATLTALYTQLNNENVSKQSVLSSIILILLFLTACASKSYAAPTKSYSPRDPDYPEYIVQTENQLGLCTGFLWDSPEGVVVITTSNCSRNIGFMRIWNATNQGGTYLSPVETVTDSGITMMRSPAWQNFSKNDIFTGTMSTDTPNHILAMACDFGNRKVGIMEEYLLPNITLCPIIDGAPVFDADGNLVGVYSGGQVLTHLDSIHFPPATAP